MLVCSARSVMLIDVGLVSAYDFLLQAADKSIVCVEERRAPRRSHDWANRHWMHQMKLSSCMTADLTRSSTNETV